MQASSEAKHKNAIVECHREPLAHSRVLCLILIVVLQNKRDLFAAKLRSVPLSSYFPSYAGGSDDVSAACSFLRGQFESKNRSPDKHVHTCITAAALTDPNSNAVPQLLNELRHILQFGHA